MYHPLTFTQPLTYLYVPPTHLHAPLTHLHAPLTHSHARTHATLPFTCALLSDGRKNVLNNMAGAKDEKFPNVRKNWGVRNYRSCRETMPRKQVVNVLASRTILQVFILSVICRHRNSVKRCFKSLQSRRNGIDYNLRRRSRIIPATFR